MASQYRIKCVGYSNCYKNRSIFYYDLRRVLTMKINSLESNVVSLNCVKTKLSKTQILLYSTNRKLLLMILRSHWYGSNI